MKNVDDYLKEERLKEVSKDLAKARGLLERSLNRLENAREREIDKTNAFQVLENIYESIRESIESLMAVKGFKSEDHVATIAWGAENLSFSKAEINKLHKFRKLRNASRYEAEEISPKQANKIMDFAEDFVDRLEDLIKEELS